jgi:surface protein
MSNKNGWGDGASNNTIGWGQGANNYIGWGSSELVSYEGLTNIVGAFTTKWTTTAPSEQIALPYGVGTYTGTIYWGDGSTSVNDGTITTHTYATAGTYTVIIRGTCTGWNFNTIGGSTYITSVVNWGQLQLGPENSGYNFYGCPNLDLSSVQGTLDLTGVTILDGLFYECKSLTSVNNINSWDTSAITSMAEMFYNCSVFNQALSFNTSAVTIMGSMFANCSAFNQSLSFNTSAVESMGGMFNCCSVFNQPLSFDTSSVTDTRSMFEGAERFNQPLSFNTSAVTNMNSMFSGCSVFNSALSFNTSAVENMEGMFRDATAFNQALSFDTSAVTNMGEMFKDAPAFNKNIGTWNVANVQDFSEFMGDKTPATFSTTNLNAIYNGWSTQAVQPSLDISFGTAKYTAAATAGRLVLTGTKLWTITDGGL